MDYVVAFNQIFVIFILLLTGFIVRKLKIVDGTFIKNLSQLLFNIVLPAMIISAFNKQFSLEITRDAVFLIAISIAIILLSYVISVVSLVFFSIEQSSRNVFQYSIMFSNFAFMGYPVIEALFGEVGILYAAFFTFPIYIFFSTFGLNIFMRKEKNKISDICLYDIITPPLIGLIVGMCLFFFSIQLPKPIAQSVSLIGSTITPLAMILVGIILANASLTKLFSGVKVYLISFIRLVVIPFTVLIVLRLLDFDLLMVGIPVIITAMPIAANTAILAEQFDGDAFLGAQVVFISTVLSLFTIPFIVLFL